MPDPRLQDWTLENWLTFISIAIVIMLLGYLIAYLYLVIEYRSFNIWKKENED